MPLVTIKAEAKDNLLQLVQQAQGQTDQPVLVVYRERQAARIYFDGAQKDRRAAKN